jgi:hypothetical protein
VITTFDVIHDAVDPAGILRAIRAALRLAGRCVCVDINCGERPTDNTGQIATPLRVQPQLLPASVPRRGQHWSWTCGLVEPVLRGMTTDAGLPSVRHVPIDDPFNTIDELAC